MGESTIQDQFEISGTEIHSFTISVRGDNAGTIGGLRELIRAAEAAGLSDETRIESLDSGAGRLTVDAIHERELAIARAEPTRIPSAIEIADALRDGTRRLP